MTHIIRLSVVALFLLIAHTTHAQLATFYFYSWSDDGSRFVVGVQNGNTFVVTVYNELWQPLAYRSLPCCSISLSPDGKELLTTGPTSEILDTDTLQTVRALPISIGGARWSPDGNELAAFTSGPPGMMEIYSAIDGRLLRSFDLSVAAPWNWPLGPIRSPDGTLFVTGVGGQLAFLDAMTGRQIFKTIIVDGDINSYSWSLNSKQVAISLTKQVSTEIPGSFPAGDSAGTHFFNSIVIVDIATGSVRSLRSGFRYSAFPLVWSPDDSQIATYLDGNVAILDSFSGDVISSFVPTMNASFVGYSPSGGRLVMGLYNNLPFQPPVNEELTNSNVQLSAEQRQIELNGIIEILVPIATLDRFAEIAASCNAPATLTSFDTSLQAEAMIDAQAQTLVTQLDRLPDNAIPLACAADLRAIVEAIQAESGR